MTTAINWDTLSVTDLVYEARQAGIVFVISQKPDGTADVNFRVTTPLKANTQDAVGAVTRRMEQIRAYFGWGEVE